MVQTTGSEGLAGPEIAASRRVDQVQPEPAAAREGPVRHDQNAAGCGDWVEAAACWDETRWRRNDASRTEMFDIALATHTAMHTSPLPWVRVDRAHAIDTWQRVLLLHPEAGIELQIAALFHDVNKVIDEAEERLEHRASDYQAFKDAHAQRGAELAYEALTIAGLPASITRRACALLAGHERRPESHEERVLADADALSFLSLLSPGYKDAFGVEHAERKVRHTLARLGPESRPGLVKARLRSDLRPLVDEGIRSLGIRAV